MPQDPTEQYLNQQNDYQTKAQKIDNHSCTIDPRVLHLTSNIKQELTKTLENIGSKLEQKMRQNPYDTQISKPLLGGNEQLNHNDISEYKAAFNQFVRSGNETAVKEMQLKAITIAGTGAEGGVLVTPQLFDKIIASIKNESPMRSLCKTVTVTSNVADFIVDPYLSGAGWVSEIDARPETSTSSFQKVSVPVHSIYAQPKASQRILDDSAFDVEGWITERVAEKFISLENEAFVKGDGINKPAGILLKQTSTTDAWTWGKIATVKTGIADNLPTTNPADVLLDLIYALKSGYRSNAVFMMNSKTLSRIRKFKDADGRYLISDTLSDINQPYLFGYKVVINEDIDDIGANKLPILFGDFQKGYVIVDAHDIRVLRDPYSAKPYVYFYVTKRVGGDVLDYDAIKALRVSV